MAVGYPLPLTAGLLLVGLTFHHTMPVLLALCLLLVVVYQAFETCSADLIIDQLVVGFQVKRVEREISLYKYR
jgi:hypothetical protein